MKEELKNDRARVQAAKISPLRLNGNFPRQRLRPTLYEGSHITCPRCNGVGVIRDTAESSAIQEFSVSFRKKLSKMGQPLCRLRYRLMSAHSFSMKRETILPRLNLVIKIKIFLIPNKNLETPHYQIERIRPDDERLDSVLPSYERVESFEAETNEPYSRAPLNSILRTDQSKFLLLKDFLHVKKLRSMLTPRAKAQPKENKQSFWQKLTSVSLPEARKLLKNKLRKKKLKPAKSRRLPKVRKEKLNLPEPKERTPAKAEIRQSKKEPNAPKKPKSRPVPPQKPKARETELKTDALLRKPRRFHSRLQQKANRKKSNLRDVLRKRLNRQNAPEKPLKFLLLLRPTMKQKLKQLH